MRILVLSLRRKLMAEIIIEKSANDVWKVAADKLLNEKKLLDGRNGEYREILHTFITIKDPRQKWVYNRVPAISIAYALAEIVWILNGDNAAKIINYWNPALNKFAGDYKYYPGAYGKRIRSHFKFDQLEGAYNALMNNPNSRQVVIQIYDPEVDFPIDKGSNLRVSYHSTAQLASNLFIRSFNQAEKTYTAMESRGYDGEINVIMPKINHSVKFNVFAVIYVVITTAIAIFSRKAGI